MMTSRGTQPPGAAEVPEGRTGLSTNSIESPQRTAAVESNDGLSREAGPGADLHNGHVNRGLSFLENLIWVSIAAGALHLAYFTAETGFLAVLYLFALLQLAEND